MNPKTGETRWSLAPHEALGSEEGLLATQALVAENPLWRGVEGGALDLPAHGTGLFAPVHLEDNVPEQIRAAMAVYGENDDGGNGDGDGDGGTSTALVVAASYDHDEEAAGAPSAAATSASAAASVSRQGAGALVDALPDDWEEVYDEDTGSTFYYNNVAGTSQWERPLRMARTIARVAAAFSSSGSTDDAGATRPDGESALLQLTDGAHDAYDEPADDAAAAEQDAVDGEGRTGGGEAETTDTNTAAAAAAAAGVSLVADHEDMQAAVELAEPWEEVVDEDSGQVYFYNAQTGESRWDRPREMLAAMMAARAFAEAGTDANTSAAAAADNGDLVVVSVVEQPMGPWEMLVNGDGVQYWYNNKTGETSADGLIAGGRGGGGGSGADAGLGYETTADDAYFSEDAAVEGAAVDDSAETAGQAPEAAAAVAAEDGGAGGAAEDPSSAVENWEEVDDGEGGKYYYNHQTGESRWELPRKMLLAMSALTALSGVGLQAGWPGAAIAEEEEAAAGQGEAAAVAATGAADEWEEVQDADGSTFYYNVSTGETQWENPYA